MTDETKPILVDASTTPAAVLTIGRYALTAIGTMLLVNNGLIDNAGLQNLVGGILAVVPALYGMLLTRRDIHKQQAMESKLPDSVAHRK